MSRGEAHGMSKLTTDKVVEIRALYADGEATLKELSIQFRVHRSAIGKIIRRKIWRHV
jgi:predicted DNA-binding protein YlxM (UPF0122 family)